MTHTNLHQATRGAKWKNLSAQELGISRFHYDRPAFRLPFSPEDYKWWGPVTLDISLAEVRRGHYRRGVTKYVNLIRKGKSIPPVLIIWHDAWGWTMQDGNHRIEAVHACKLPTFQAYFGKPKNPKPDDEF